MLELRKVTIRYQQLSAVRDVSLAVEEGELTALIGSNGAGKTSLLNAISGLTRMAQGDILWQEKNISDLAPHLICDLGIVQVPEGRKLFPRMTVLENLEMGAYLKSSRKRAKENFDRVFALFPRLLERCGQIAGSLSGGEQQMLAVGRALMACPKLLILDEPSLGLAPIMAAEIFKIVSELNRGGLSVLLISQEVLQTLAIAAKAYLLENGEIALYGKASDLLDDPRIKTSYLGI
jgi:branched-chain amino acid transport system ATP-binding protein